jgi:hypothetical protein
MNKARNASFMRTKMMKMFGRKKTIKDEEIPIEEKRNPFRIECITIDKRQTTHIPKAAIQREKSIV